MLRLEVKAGTDRPDRPAGRPIASWRDDAGQAFACAYADPDCYRLDWNAAARFVFRPPDPLVIAQVAACADLGQIHALFHRAIEPIVLTAYGFQALHGSAVSAPDGAVLFTGEATQGKSTFAYGLAVSRGWAQLADDAVVIEVRGHESYVRPLEFAPRLRRGSEEHFRGADAPSPAGTAPQPIPLRAICVLEQHHTGDLHMARLHPAEAFRTLLAHAHRLDPTDRTLRARFVSDYLTLAAGVQTYRVAYGRSFDRFAADLDAIVSVAVGSTGRP